MMGEEGVLWKGCVVAVLWVVCSSAAASRARRASEGEE